MTAEDRYTTPAAFRAALTDPIVRASAQSGGAFSDQASDFVGEAGYAAPSESSDQIDWREGRLAGVVSLLSEDITILGARSSWSSRKPSGCRTSMLSARARLLDSRGRLP